jgi:hypothetical protein
MNYSSELEINSSIFSSLVNLSLQQQKTISLLEILRVRASPSHLASFV